MQNLAKSTGTNAAATESWLVSAFSAPCRVRGSIDEWGATLNRLSGLSRAVVGAFHVLSAGVYEQCCLLHTSSR